MKNTLTNIIMENGKLITRRICESYIKKNYFKFYEQIVNSFDSSLSFNAKLYLIYNGLTENPKCFICGKDVRFKKFSEGFSKYCSMQCVGDDPEIQLKRENTTEALYGGKYTLTSPKLRENVKKTNLIKYGVEYPQQSAAVKKKIKETNRNKYGVEYPQQSEVIREKTKKTNIDRYGFENVNQNCDVRDKTKKTNLIKYGACSPAQNIKVQNKIKNTNQKKYGVDFSFQSKLVQKKIKEVNIIRYGFEQPSRNELVKEKIKNTNKITKQKNSIIFWSKRLGLDKCDINYNELGEIMISKLCKIHETFIMSKSLLKNRLRANIENICTLCNPINENVSIKETEVKKFIESELNLCCEKLRINNSEADIYISSHKLGIEFNGLYWHSDLYKDNDYHLNKTNLYEKNNIQLIQIFEDEWVNKKEIVKSIIKSKLGFVDNKLFAVKCEIKKVDNGVCFDFLENNDIRGNISSSIKLGLYYKNELVSIMCFGKKRAGFGGEDVDEYELLRFCDKLNTVVIDSGNKLLKHFIENYHPKNIVTYADRRYSQGKTYKQLGFSFINNTKPNYSYFDNNKKELKRHQRYSYKKNMLVEEGFDINKTEHKIMEERGFLRIYDCGNINFKLFLKK